MRPALFLKAFFAAAALALAGPAAAAESAEELIQKGNVFYDKLQPAEALKYYLPAEKLAPAKAAGNLLSRPSHRKRSERGSAPGSEGVRRHGA